jgi:tetratricopeptide (TPR) repeat protein
MDIPQNKNLNVNPSQQEMSNLERLANSYNFNALEKKTNQLIERFPQNNNLQNILGYALKGQWKYTEALKVFEKIIENNPNFYFAYNNAGNILKELCRLDEAKDLYKKSIKINPKFIDSYINLGQIFLDLNQLSEASAVFNEGLKLEPKQATLHRYLSQVTKYNEKNLHLKNMEKIILDENLTDDKQMHLCFALGKAYEDIKYYDKAFSYWKKGNSLKKSTLKYSVNDQKKLIQSVKKNFTKELFEKFKDMGSNDETLIFIIGMPRSGTTLTQQILSSHPKVIGAGESNEFSNKIKHNFFQDDEFLKNLNKYDSVNFNKIGNDYIKSIRQYSSNAKYILVKDLLNFPWVGFIKIIFPRAKVIHCKRNPLDNCLSLYKNYFVGGVDFSYDLNDLGNYYNLYKDIMVFWNNILPNYCEEIVYEELINNPKEQIKKLLNACNLEWDENCMQFYNNKRFISTGSNSINVHQPIYKSSMKSWKFYEKELKTLFDIIKI